MKPKCDRCGYPIDHPVHIEWRMASFHAPYRRSWQKPAPKTKWRLRWYRRWWLALTRRKSVLHPCQGCSDPVVRIEGIWFECSADGRGLELHSCQPEHHRAIQ